ncbi:MAG: SixA phosphatase family protein [Algoriphagus aquaeductus]|uniref:Phosphohistidine phosphatase n=1 Tax=Algoriphagus aquaeductus TaxID=475299 RepID=A0A326RNU6_9BACT|nr:MULTISPECIES: histidine phosphatase family protein [Algoriphagus]PZV81501.1 phosphohistidine phosphatase [Algoriphagus aquaeductus]
MKQLILLRHGEAGFSDGVDFQRQLTSKGKDQLHKLGTILKEREMEIDLMYCSSATRTRETAEIIKSYLPIREEVYEKEIYAANLEILLQILENTPKSIHTCLLIGHNPTISLLLSHLTTGNYVGLQPGMMAILEIEVQEWYMVGMNTALLRELLK